MADEPKPRFRLSYIGALVIIFAVLAGLVVGLAYSPIGREVITTPVIVSVVALCSSAIPGVLGLAKASAVHDDMKNGVMEEKMKSAVEQALKEREES